MDPFTTTILKLKGTGFFEFMLPFMITAAMFYGLLRKSQIFGDPDRNVVVNAVVALTAAFMVWSYPVLIGISFSDKLPTFFAHAMSAMLVLLVGVLMTSMFLPPDLPSQLKEKLGGRAYGIILVASLLIGGAIFVSSGLINLFLPGGVQGPAISDDALITIGVTLIFVIAVIVMIWPGKGGGEKK